ncbi:MAG: DUF302 domain-containing protein [Woeseiaceae bacterium]
MSYYFAKTLNMPFDRAIDAVVEQLKKEGFGVLTTIDIQETLKRKLGVDFPRYTILGACNPAMAHQALQAEDKIGTMLPCNVIVRDLGDDTTEVAAVDPVASMQSVNNPNLAGIAASVQQKLASVVRALDA